MSSAVFNISGNNYLQFNNSVSGKGNQIGYNLPTTSTRGSEGTLSNALDIVGNGTGGSRTIKLWDNVIINSELTTIYKLPIIIPLPEKFTSNTFTYNNSTYTVSASSVYSANTNPYTIFNGDGFVTINNSYFSSGFGYNISNTSTTLIGSTTVTGEWIQIQNPDFSILTKYSLAVYIDDGAKPISWYILGSNNGSTFTIIDQITDYNWQTFGSEVPFPLDSNKNSYTYYRIVVNKIIAAIFLRIKTWGLTFISSAGLITTSSITANSGGTINIDASTTGSVLKAITKTAGDNSTNVATTAYVDGASTKSQEFAIPYFNSSSNTFVNANGTFNASSSNTNINASFAFTNDNTSTTVSKSWSSAASRYNSSTSIATTLSDTTTNYGGATVYGENLQIELPYNLKLTSYILAPINTGRPKSWNIYGSSNSIKWTLIESRSDYTWTSNSPVTFTCSPAQTIFYKHFRLVIIKISDNTGIVSIANWNLLGTSDIDVNAVKFYNNNSIVNEETIQTITAAKTFSGGLTVSAGGLTVSAGDLTITAGDLKTGSITRISNAGAISNISTINTSGLITAGGGLTVSAGGLKVDGKITGDANNSIKAQHQIEAASFNVTSDIRIKKNIEYQNTNSSLETIRLLKPAKYDFIDSKKKICHGFLAQELEEILPSLITNSNNYIPNIFSNATVNGDGFKVTILNEKFSLFDLKNKENAKIEYTDASNNIFIAKIKEIIDEKTFIVQEKIDFDTIFIKGEEIEDFKSIDPIQIISLNTASIIQLDKELSEAKNKIIELENKIDELLKKI